MASISLDGPDGQARRAASGDEPKPECSSPTPPRPVSTTRVSTRPLSEKELVYRELEHVQRKCAAHKREIENLRAAGSAQEAAVLRIEANRYRQALSYIAHRLTQGDLPEEDLRSIVSSALLLRGLKARDRRRVERVWERAESQELGRKLDDGRTARQRRRDRR